jgi:hypothetical protein
MTAGRFRYLLCYRPNSEVSRGIHLRGLSINRWIARFDHRAWSSHAAHIRWQGACGHFEGRATNH